MKCILCKNELTRRSYYQWEVTDKKAIVYECTDKTCCDSVGYFARSVVQITEPDNVITYFYFRYEYDGKIYKLRSYNETKPLTILQIHVQGALDENVLHIPRYMNMLITDDFPEKVIEIHKKLLQLIIFS